MTTNKKWAKRPLRNKTRRKMRRTEQNFAIVTATPLEVNARTHFAARALLQARKSLGHAPIPLSQAPSYAMFDPRSRIRGKELEKVV
jgi:hypothetical protein